MVDIVRNESDRIAPNLRTLRILELLGRSDTPMSVNAISAELDLPRQTVYRLCATLTEQGFLTFQPGRKGLRPARRARLMASGILFASRAHMARRQILEAVARDVGETVNFVVPEGSGMSYVDRVETRWAFRVQLPIGTHVPFHCTASGKTFLASLPRSARRKMILSLELERLTERTITDAASLIEEIDRIARQGFAIDDEEFVANMIAIAVPVHDPQGRFVAALAFHGPTLRLDHETLLARKSVLLEASQKLTEALFTP